MNKNKATSLEKKAALETITGETKSGASHRVGLIVLKSGNASEGVTA